MSQPSSAVKIKLDIDAIAGKINTDLLTKEVQAQIKKTLADIKKSKTTVAVGFDLEKISKGALDAAIKQFEAEIEKATKKLSSKRNLRLGIAEALTSELLKAKSTIEKDGKIVGTELEKVLKTVAAKFKLSTNIANQRSPLRDFLLLEGDSVKAAVTELNAQASLYQKAIDKLYSQRTKAIKQGAALREAGPAPKSEKVDKVPAQALTTEQLAAQKLEAALYKLAAAEQAVTTAKALNDSKNRLRALDQERKALIAVAEATRSLDSSSDLSKINARLTVLNTELTSYDRLRKMVISLAQAKKAADAAGTKSEAAKKTKVRDTELEALKEQRQAILQAIAAYKQLQREKSAQGRFVPDKSTVGENLSAKLGDVNARLRYLSEDKKLTDALTKSQEAYNKALAAEVLANKLGQGGAQVKALKAQEKAILDIVNAREAMAKALGLKIADQALDVYRKKLDALAAQLKALQVGDAKVLPKGTLAEGGLKKQLQEVIRLRTAYQKASQDAKLAANVGSPDFHLKQLSRERTALLELTTSYERLQHLKLQATRSTPGPSSVLRDTALGNNTLKGMSDSLKDLNGQLRGFDSLWTTAAQSMKLFFRYAVGYKILYEISGAIANVTKGVIDFQNAIVSIKAVTDATNQEMLQTGAAILGVAQDTKYSVTEVAEGARTLAQAGIPIEKLGSVLRATANLASTTNGTIAESADLISTFTLVYKDFDPSILADKLANAANISKLSLGDLSTVISRLIETTEGYTVGIDQMLGATETLRNVGIKPSTIATGTRQAILEIFSPDHKLILALQKRYAELGQDMSESAIKSLFNSFKDAKDPLLAAINELQKLGFAGTAGGSLDRVFDTRAENVIRALVQNKDAYVKNVEDTKKVGSAAKGAATQLESLTNSVTNLGSALVSLGTDIGLSTVNSLAKGIESITDKVKEARNVINELKLNKGDTGVEQSSQLGVGAGLLAFGKGLGAFKSLGLGLAVTAATEWATIVTRGNEQMAAFIKAVNAAVSAVIIFAAATKLSKNVTVGSAVAAGANTLRSVQTAATAVQVGGVAAAVTSGVKNAATGAASKVTALGSKFGVLLGKTNLLGLALTTAYLAYGAWDSFTKDEKTSEEKFAAKEQAKIAKVEEAKADLEKLNTKNAGIEEGRKNTADFVASAAEVSEIVAEYSQIGKQGIDKVNDSAVLSLKKASDDLKAVGVSSDISGAFGKSTPEIKALLDKAIAGTKDIGTQAFQDLVSNLEQLRGLEAGAIDKGKFATKLQAASDFIQKAEAERASYIRQLELALSNPGGADNKAIIEAYQKLPADVKQFLQTTVSTFDGAKELLKISGEGSLNLKTELASTAEGVEKVFQSQISLARTIANEMLSAVGDAKRIKQGELQGMLEAAVKDGSTKLVEGLVDVIKAATGEDLSPTIAAAKENAKQKILKSISEKVKGIDTEIPTSKASLAPLSEFSANSDKKVIQEGKKQIANEIEFTKLGEDKLSLAKTIKAQYEALEVQVKAGTISEEDVKLQLLGIAVTEQSLANVKNKQSKIAGVNLEAETKIAAIKRSFVINEEDILSKERRLKELTSAKVQDLEAVVALSADIYAAKQAQLNLEKKVLEDDLRKKVEDFRAGDTKGLNGQQILDALNNEAGRKLLADNEELAKTVQAYTDVMHRSAALEESHLTELQNVYGKQLEREQSKLTTQQNKTQAIESQLQTVTGKLADARSRLAELYDKRVAAENFYDDALRVKANGGATKDDLQAAVDTAQGSPSIDAARQVVDIAKELLQAGKLSKSDYKSKVEDARAIELGVIANDVSELPAEIRNLGIAQTQLSAAMELSIQEEKALTSSIERLTAAMEALPTQLAQQPSTEVAAKPQEPVSVEAPAAPAAVPHLAGGGLVTDGPDGIDTIDARLTKHEYVMPVTPTRFYGKEFMDKLRSMQIPRQAVTMAPAVSPGQTASASSIQAQDRMKNYQPVNITIGGATISALAQPDPIEKFKQALSLQSLKTGKRATK